jgi:hypothetical protein
MHSVLFVAQPGDRFANDWQEFSVLAANKTGRDKKAVRLAENVWLLDLTERPASLGWLIATAETKGVSYGLLPFEHAPQWLPVGFDPKTIQGQNGGSQMMPSLRKTTKRSR